MDAAIRCEGLVKRFGDFVALDGLSLEVPAGTIFGFLGPNGAGKTTTIRLLTALDAPTTGQAFVLGHDVQHGGPPFRRRISHLDQNPGLYDWMTGRELLEFVGGLFSIKGQDLKARVDQVLEETMLTAAAKRRVRGYSGGMRQRLGLAQALVNEPDVLILDEPASSLDPAGRRDILDIIARMRGRSTIFMSTHILADVERVCDAVAILDEGKLLVESSLHDLQERYARPVFILEPEAWQEEKVAPLVETVRQRPWSTGVRVEHGEIRVNVGDPQAASVELLSIVAETGVPLARFQRDRPSLEDIFLELIDGNGGAG